MKKVFDYPTKAIIDLKAFDHNINFIRKKFPESKIILPVKANAYGHGIEEIVPLFQQEGIEHFAVFDYDGSLYCSRNYWHVFNHS